MLAGVCTCDVFSPQCLAVKKNPTLNSHLGDNPAHNLPDFILRQLFHSLRALMVCHVPLEGAKPQESVVLSCAAITSSRSALTMFQRCSSVNSEDPEDVSALDTELADELACDRSDRVECVAVDPWS